MKKIILYLMTKKGLDVLNHILINSPPIVDYIVVSTDKNLANDYSREILDLAKAWGIKAYLRGAEPAIPDERYVFCISWRWMISHPKQRLIIFHDSLLPRYRGFAPLVNMLINGESVIGVTALLGDKSYDEGNILAQASVNVEYPIKIRDAIELNMNSFKLVVDAVIENIVRCDYLEGEPQDHCSATYSIWREEHDYRIDWSRKANEIKRFIDAVGEPYSGAISKNRDDETIKIIDAEVIEPDVFCEIRDHGKVIFVRNGKPIVICGQGLLRLTEAYKLGESGWEDLFPLKKFRTRFL